MAIKYKTDEDIAKLQEIGAIHARILKEVARRVKPGIKTSDLNTYVEQLIDEAGCIAAFLGYKPKGVKTPYPASLCVSINEEIVHGIPSERELKSGDIVSLDIGLSKDGLVTDSAITVPCGDVDDVGMKLIRGTEEALMAGIKSMRLAGHIGDIGAEVMKVAEKNGFTIAEDLSGHGVGYNVHEEPFVPNEALAGEGPEIKQGLVIAIEPMLCEGRPAVKCLPDEYTYVTRDGKRSAHFEHTVAITKRGVEVLTKI